MKDNVKNRWSSLKYRVSRGDSEQDHGKSKKSAVFTEKNRSKCFWGWDSYFFTIVHIRNSAIDSTEGTGDTSSKPATSEIQKRRHRVERWFREYRDRKNNKHDKCFSYHMKHYLWWKRIDNTKNNNYKKMFLSVPLAPSCDSSKHMIWDVSMKIDRGDYARRNIFSPENRKSWLAIKF